MVRPVKGDIVVIPFPFSDLSAVKRRPAFVVQKLPGNDLILCQITSQKFRDKYSLLINKDDFARSGLNRISFVRPGRIFTADIGIVKYRIGSLKEDATEKVIHRIIDIIKA